MDTIVDRLGRRPPRISSDEIARWTGAEPALTGATTTSELISCCERGGDLALAALLRCAGTDRVAAELVLAALAPGLNRLTGRLCGWADDREEVAARVAAAAWSAVSAMAGEPPAWPSTAILDRVRDAVRSELRADRRRTGRFVGMADCPEQPVLRGEPDETDVLGDAVRAGQIDHGDAWLIRVTRVDGLSLADVARATGARHDGLRRRRSRAERLLRVVA
ncbi:MAG: hypothetical protein ACYDH6_23530 [Acidimicrobiales bacterium]